MSVMNVTVLSSLLLHQKLFWVCFIGMALTMVSCLSESVVEWCFAILWTSVVVYAKGNFLKYILCIYYRHGDVQPAMWHRTWGSGGTQHGSCGLWKFCPGVTVLVDRALKKQKTKQKKEFWGSSKLTCHRLKNEGEKNQPEFEFFLILSSVTLQASEFVTDFWEWLQL